MTDPEYMKILLGFGGFEKLPAFREKLVPLKFKRNEELLTYVGLGYKDDGQHKERRDGARARVMKWLDENSIPRDHVSLEGTRKAEKADYGKRYCQVVLVRVSKPITIYVPVMEDEWWDEMEEKTPQRIVLKSAQK